jgi:hypothetical protein
MLGGLGGVGHWSRVGHCEHRGEPAARGGKRAGLHRLSVFSTRFTQMGVQVDHARQSDQPVCIHLVYVGSRVGRINEPAIPDQQV